MEHRHEIINFPENSPIKVFIHKIGDVNMHWHQSIEILYIVNGKVKINVSGTETELTDDGLILINSNTPHSLYSTAAIMIAVQIRLDLLTSVPDLIKNSYFDCVCTGENSSPELFIPIKNCLASLLKLNIEGKGYMNLMNVSLCYKLIYELYLNFVKNTNSASQNNADQLKRLNMILSYINANYADDLSLESLSSVVNFTVPYLSKFFKQHMGMTVGDYIKSIRLFHAAELLSTTTDSMEMICSKCGFPNTHSFISTFKTKYNIIPSKWRKQNKNVSVLKNPEKAIGYQTASTEILYSSVSGFINKYADMNMSVNPDKSLVYEKDSISVSESSSVKLRQTDHSIIGVSRVKELLYAPIRKMLEQAQKAIGFKYVKMHSVFDDDLMVYSEYDGKPHYNFSLVDQAYDFLLSINLKPYVQFSFMPSAIAKNPSNTTFFAKVVISMPGNMEKWNKLVETFLKHLTDRYGKSEVESWPFAVWNEPFTSSKLFGFDSASDYYDLYFNTYKTVKSFDPSIIIGGPSHFAAHNKPDYALSEFLQWTYKQGCIPDFIDLHYYDTDMSRLYLDKNGMKVSTQLSPEEGTFGKALSRIENMLLGTPFENIPIYLTEWNSTSSHRDLLSDTCFKSSYIVRNLIENYGRLAAFGYWLLSDLHEESLLNNRLFHGGLGLFTINGIQKPSYFAYRFLSMLGNEILAKDKDYIVTKKQDGYVLLLVNYCHYSQAYSEEIGINITYTDRYTVFPENGKKRFCFSFPESEKKYLCIHQYVNREHGSAFDNFVAMGAVEPLSEEETNWLKEITRPCIKKEIINAPVNIDVILQPFEIRLIEIKPYRQ